MSEGNKTKSKPFHALTTEELFSQLRASESGLSEEEAKKRLEKFGPNELPKEKPLSAWRIFFAQFHNPLVYILVIAALITLALGSYVDAVIILIAVATNMILGFLQERQASRTIEAIRDILKLRSIVVRNGRQKEITQDLVVPGDIIIINPGDKVPADARLLEAKDLRAAEAILSGESLPEEKEASVLKEETILGDRKNMVFMGTLIESGFGKAIVVATGEKSEIGKVAVLVQSMDCEKSLEQKQLARFGRTVGKIIGVIAIFILIVGMARGIDFISMFTTSIAIALAAIPEGLPAAMTLILALGVARILGKGGMIRKLASAETLGAVGVICTDKTGTLTRGKMRLTGIYSPSDKIEFEDSADLKKINKDSSRSEALSLKIAVFCSQAFIENPTDEPEKWIARGRPTEKAMVTAARCAGIDRAGLLKDQPLIAKLLFDPLHKYSASLNRLPDGNKILYILGAPELILRQTKSLYLDGREEKITKENLEKLKLLYRELAGKGLRVLAAAYKKTSAEAVYPYDGRALIADDQIVTDTVFVSYLALHDPLRPETKEAIALCRKAGIRPVIVTGDHQLTAKAVAEAIGLPAGDNNIINGGELEKLTEATSPRKMEDISIYARVEPHQKSEIIQSFQSRGEIVAMTGDGVNDAPALKKADIGVALGSGTEVAKESSDLVLLEDNFKAIVAAVHEGRAIIENIRKIFTYLISDSFAEVALILFALIVGWPMPLLAAQIIWANLIEAGLTNLALAFEPTDPDLSNHRPQVHSMPFINIDMRNLSLIIGVITNLLLIGLFIYLYKFAGYSLVHLRTVIFASVSFNSLLFVFSCRGLRKSLWQIDIFSNRFLILAWVLGIAALFIAVYLAAMNTLLGTVPLNLFDWVLILCIGLLDILLIELAKWWIVVRQKGKKGK